MKKINQNSSTLNTDYNQNKNLEIDKIKTTNINILLNRVRQDKKKEIKKKILLTSLIFFILSLISLIIFK